MSTFVTSPHLPPDARITKRGRTVALFMPAAPGTCVVAVDTSEVPPRWTMEFMARAACELRRQGVSAKARRGTLAVTA